MAEGPEQLEGGRRALLRHEVADNIMIYSSQL